MKRLLSYPVETRFSVLLRPGAPPPPPLHQLRWRRGPPRGGAPSLHFYINSLAANLARLIHGFSFFCFNIRLTEADRATTSVKAMINRDLSAEAVAKTASVNPKCRHD